jgi:signal transduction histidine kinase
VHASASDALATILVRTFAILHALSVLFLLCYVAVWWPWYATHPVGMAAVAVTAAWGATFVVVSLRRGIGTALAAVNVAVAVILGVAAPLFMPEETLGAPWTWLFATTTHACVVAAWVFPEWVFVAVVVAVAGAAAAGAPAPSRLGTALVLLVVFAPSFRMVIGRLRRLAARADRRLEHAAARRRVEAVAAARARDRRERERVLHDTVLNTLTGIGWGGGIDVALARRRCGEAAVAVRELLDGRRRELSLGLAERLRHIVDAARARGLDVTTAVDRSVGVPPAVPPDVVSAFGAAAAELLANVERHAGTGRARLEAQRDQATATVTVAVHDDGPGFDASAVPADRLGLRRSVYARMADVGARVAVDSEPGRGTSIMISWQAPSSVHGTHGAGAAASPPVSGSGAELRRAFAAELRRGGGIIAAAWQTITFVSLLASLPRAQSPVLALFAWLVVSVGVALAIRVLRRRPLSGLQCVTLVAFGVAATAVGAANTADTPATGDIAPWNLGWPALTLPLLVMLVAVSRPVAEWLLALAATAATLATVVLTRAGTEPLAVSQLAGTIYGQCALLTFAAMVGPVLRRTAERTAQAVRAEAELAALHDTENLVRQDRARGLRAIERDVVPLLAAVGDGLLDPRDPAVRDRCARHGGAVRRTLAAGQSAALDGLAPALVDAEERGVQLDVQVSGDLRRAPAQVRTELATHMAGALAAVPNDGAMLTLFCDAAGGSLFLTYPSDNAGHLDGDRPPTRLPPAGHTAPTAPRPLVAVSTDYGDGRVCMELRWDGTQQTAGPPTKTSNVPRL